MNLHVINTGYFKLDGGAMFGVVPKSIWNRINPSDENNMCTWTMRCLLIEYNDKLVLIDNGIGDKQSEKFYSFYYLHGDNSLDKSLNEKGFSKDDITDVFLTHLHFDHCGGSINYNKQKDIYEPAFKNATYWSNKDHWEWAVNPNQREKASFLKENILPIQESGQLKFTTEGENPFEGFSILNVNGHTESMMIPHIKYGDKTIAYMADLLPSAGHVPLPYVMAYDVRPLQTLKEKSAFLSKAFKNNYTLFFEHDKENECCSLKETEKGIRVDKTFNLSEIL